MNWRLWLSGAIAALIGGAASSVSVMIVDPLDFNFDTGLKKLGAVALVSGVVNLASYLKQHPVPEWDGTNRRG